MFEKKCVVCGKVFPAGTPASKKYCDECAVVHRAKKKHEQNMRYKERILAAQGKKPKAYAPHQPRQLKGSDKAYCTKCLYKGRFSEDYLCNYFLMTGSVRGCKAGYGCEKRELITGTTDEQGRKQCERCGVLYIGTKSSRYCMACRKEALRANQRHMMEVRAQKSENNNPTDGE